MLLTFRFSMVQVKNQSFRIIIGLEKSLEKQLFLFLLPNVSYQHLTTITTGPGSLGTLFFFYSKPVHFIMKSYLYKRLMT